MRSGSFEKPPRDSDPPAVTHHSQDLVKSMDELLKEPRDLEALPLTERHHMATQFLLGLETVLRTLAEAMPGDSFTYLSPSDTGETLPCLAPALDPILHPEPPVTAPLSSELSLMIQEHGEGNITIGQSHARMLLSWDVATGARDSGNGRESEGTSAGEGRGGGDVARGEVLNM